MWYAASLGGSRRAAREKAIAQGLAKLVRSNVALIPACRKSDQFACAVAFVLSTIAGLFG